MASVHPFTDGARARAFDAKRRGFRDHLKIRFNLVCQFADAPSGYAASADMLASGWGISRSDILVPHVACPARSR
jgi:hypothetical protein